MRGAEERRSGVVEWWSGGVVEWWSGRFDVSWIVGGEEEGGFFDE